MSTRNHELVTVDRLRATHCARRQEIRARLREFDQIFQNGSDAQLWEETVYCIFTAGASAASGFAAVKAVRPLLGNGSRAALTRALKKTPAQRCHNVRAEHNVSTRSKLRREAAMHLA